ncbi:MAG: glycosyltransferase family 9 protein [Coriobacteriia bacterium]
MDSTETISTETTTVARHPAERVMTAAEWEPLRNVLAVRLDNIGDVIMLEPALRAIRSRSPDAKLTLLASPAGSQAVPLIEEIGEVIVHRALWQAAGPDVGQWGLERERVLIGQLRAQAFDAAVIFTSFSQSPYPAAFVCYAAGIPVRVGQSKEFGGGVLTHWTMPGSDGMHQAERNLRLVVGEGRESGDLGDLDDRMAITVPEAARVSAEAMLRSAGLAAEEFVLVAPGASCPARRYTRFPEVVAELAKRGVRPVVVGGPREADLCAEVAAASLSAVSFGGRTSVPQLAALVERASAVVANDSLALHLAEALQTPLAVLYSGTEEPSQFGPRHTRFALLGSFPPCSPCHAFSCPGDMRCLDIDPAHVAEVTIELAATRSVLA